MTEEEKRIREQIVERLYANGYRPWDGCRTLADQILCTDGIEIRAENQDLPLVVNDSKDFNNAYRDIGEGYAQKYMLTPDSEGKVWRKVIPKGR